MRRALVGSLCVVVLGSTFSVVPGLGLPVVVGAAEPDGAGEVPAVPLPDPVPDEDPADQIDSLPTELDDLPGEAISDVSADSRWTDVPGMPIEVRVTDDSPLTPPDQSTTEPGDPSDTPTATPSAPTTESPADTPSDDASEIPSTDPAEDPSSLPTEDPSSGATADPIVEPELSVSLTRPEELGAGTMLLEVLADDTSADGAGSTTGEDPDVADVPGAADPAVFVLGDDPDPADPGAPDPFAEPADASGVAVRLDYSEFDDAFGGYWADRLVVTAYPSCFVETPENPDCSTGVPITATNNTVADTLRFITISITELDQLLEVANDPDSAGDGTADGTTDGPAGSTSEDDPAGEEQPSDDPTDSLTDDPTPNAAPSMARRTTSGRFATTAARVAATSAAAVDSGVTYAVTSAPGGYGPTPVAPAGEWQVGVGSGEFSYSYPFKMPPATGGSAPSLSLDYSSGSVDGMTTAENGQGSAAGMGWAIDPGFVSRSYTGCKDDGISGKGDLCWKTTSAGLYEEMTMSLNGHSAKLIPVDSGDHPNRFRLKDDPGWRIQRVTKDSPASEGDPNNDDDNDEAFKVTTTDGTVYWFGNGNDGTDSVFTVPVYGNNDKEPCNDVGSAPADHWCQQGWRWNLDKVIDPSGNVTHYYYNSEQNYYARWANVYNQTVYDRGGLLARIEYGYDRGYDGAYDRPRQIVFLDKRRRCTPQMTDPNADCTGDNDPSHAPGKWPDVPSDLICGATGACTTGSPSFFSTWRYYRVRTVVSGPDGQMPVDTWDFDHDMPDPDGPGDDNPDQPDLWLDQIQHTGYGAGAGAITEAGTNFNGIALQNRVAPGAGRKYMKFRVDTVRNPQGGRIEVNYGHANDRACTPDYVDNRDRWNSDRECFASRWTPPSGNNSSWEWFHKYVVKRIALADDTMGLSSRWVNAYASGDPGISLGRLRVYEYDYTYAPAWRYSGSPQVQQGDESWGDWRGYEVTWVQTRKTNKYGEILPGNIVQQRVTRYRGMNRQPTTMAQANNGTGPENIKLHTIRYDSTNNQPLDNPEYDGLTAETVTEDSDGGRIRLEYHKFGSVITADSGSRGRAKIRYPVEDYTSITQGGGNQTHTTTYRVADADPLGILAGAVVKVLDSGGSSSDAGDDVCTTTLYDTNIDRWFRAPKDVKTWGAGFCPQDPENPGNTNARIVAHSQTVYDDKSRPITTKVETRPEIWSTSETDYDQYGRVTRTEVPGGGLNAAGGPRTIVTAIDYNPGPNGQPGDPLDDGKLITSVRSTVQAAVQDGGDLVTTTSYAPAWGSPVKVVDPNGDTTTVTYDGLGRTKDVHYPVRGTTALASAKYEYTTSVQDPSRVRIQTLQKTAGGAEWADSYTFYDGWGRPVETQRPQPDGDGRIVSVTGYNELGQVRYAMPAAVNSHDPEFTKVLNPDPDTVRRYTITDYDALARPTTVHRRSYAADLSATTTSYTSSVTTVDPPGALGNTETTTDSLGRTTKVVQRTETGAIGDQVDYTYTETGLLATATKPLGVNSMVNDASGTPTMVLNNDNYTWEYGYDMAGRQLWTNDPDTGSTVTTYDHANNPLTVTTGPIGKAKLDTTTDPYQPNITEPLTRTTTTYDRLSRPIKLEDTTPGSGPVELTRWSYDEGGKTAHALGRLTSTTQQIPSSEFPEAALGAHEFISTFTYDNRGQVTDTTYTYPAWITGQIAPDPSTGLITLTSHTEYNQADQPLSTTYPALPGLAGLTVNATYSGGWLRSLTTGSNQLAGYAYDLQGHVTSLSSGIVDSTTGAVSGLKRNYHWDDTTGRLEAIVGVDTLNPHGLTSPPAPLRLDYTYDLNDNPKQAKVSTRDANNESLAVAAWCYTYDALNRLDAATIGADTEGNCDTTATSAANPLISQLGGRTSGYELDYKYNKDRLTNVNMTGVRLTAYNNLDAEGPHQTRNITTLNSATNWPKAVPIPSTLAYDHQGRIKEWTPKAGWNAPAALYTYNHQGQLATTTHGKDTPTEADGTYAYHADGTRMIRRTKTKDGTQTQTETVLYLPDGTEITRTTASQGGSGSTGITASVRHYTTPSGPPIATQTGSTNSSSPVQGFTWLLADLQGSVRLARPTNTNDSVVAYHYYPFGDPVTNAPPDGHGYINRPYDPTGDIRLDDRNYTPDLNQLTTPDPLLDPGDPQSYNPYAYSRNNPVTLSDPSGQMAACTEGACQSSGAVHPESAPGCVYWECFDIEDFETWWNAGLFSGDSWDPSAEVTHEQIKALSRPLPGAGLRELALAGCSWLPVAGGACDAYDAKRTAQEDGVVSWPFAASIAGFLPLGDVLKLPKQGEHIADALKSADNVMDSVREAGRAGETMAQIEKNTRRIPSASGTAAYRIPDELNDSVLGEVKNVKRLSYTSQLRDFASYAKETERVFTLYTRPGTRLSSTLQAEIDAGRILHSTDMLAPH